MRKLLMILPPLLFLGLATLFLTGMRRENPDALPSAIAGQMAPGLQVQPLGDLPLLTEDALRAPGAKLVNFWASWCAPCRAEHPLLTELAAEGVVILGINYKDAEAQAMGFLAELGNPYAAIGADVAGRTGLDWGLYGVPETFVIDGTGKVILRYPGPLTRAVLDATIRPAIAQAGG
jgi:cytochrome c biogenesis protein CcmG/thiol:disulfide interchange protein DsbE